MSTPSTSREDVLACTVCGERGDDGRRKMCTSCVQKSKNNDDDDTSCETAIDGMSKLQVSTSDTAEDTSLISGGDNNNDDRGGDDGHTIHDEHKSKNNRETDAEMLLLEASAAIDNLSNVLDRVLSRIIEIKSDKNDKLFQEPPPKEDCSICMLPMPYAENINGVTSSYMHCCGKVICRGCMCVSADEMVDGNIKRWCLFCREPIFEEEDHLHLRRLKQRMEMNDANAFFTLGMYYRDGRYGLRPDLNKTVELWGEATELGSIEAHYELGGAYLNGEVVEEDEGKAIHHYTLAAIGGHEMARHIVGLIDQRNGNMDRAMKHWMIAARSGFDKSLKKIGEGYKAGHVTKDEYAKTLRSYQVSVYAMKSEERTKAMEVTKEIQKKMQSGWRRVAAG